MSLFDELHPQQSSAGGIPGVTTGIVKENWDDKHQGMVKVEYSLGEAGKNVSGWVPVMSPYTGGGFGFYMLPEVGTEVVVAFLLGDRNCPIVVGSLWNGKVKLPEKTANKDNSIKLIHSKAGALIRFSEEKGKEKIEIQTPGELVILMDDEKQSVTIQDKDKKNKVEIDAKKGSITLEADKKLILKAGGKEILTMDGSKAELKHGSVSLEAQQSLKVKGQSSKYEGASVEVKASGTLKLDSGGITQVKGSMVKIN